MSDVQTKIQQYANADIKDINPENIEAMNIIYKEFLADTISKYEIEIAEAENAISKTKAEESDLWEQQKEASWEVKEKINAKRSLARIHIKSNESKLVALKNLVACLSNNGTITQITDELGFKHGNIPDFRTVNTNEIAFDEDTVLITPKPVYVPIIEEESFKHRGYIFDAIRIDKNSYLLCTSKYDEALKVISDEEQARDFEGVSSFVIVTLDQLVLISDYYFKRAKALNQQKADEQNIRSEKYYDSLSFAKRESFLNQKGYYHSLPAKVKKEINQADYEALSVEEKEKLYKPFKKYGAERIKSKLDEHHMWSSFHKMYQRFVNKNAHLTNKNGELQPDAKSGFGLFANPETWKYWQVFREMLDYKMKDIQSQREYLSEGYKTALETSFGESNTSIALQEQFGVLIKRQNGDMIKPFEQEQIESALIDVQKAFGSLKAISLKKNLKISHTGKKMCFASSKAIGLFIPSMLTVAVSDKYGDNQFKSTMAHEMAHFIDNYIGELSGKMYATDDYESNAGILAFTFRNNMNKPKQYQNDYINATQECFARALQQYFGIEVFGEEATIAYSYTELDREMPIFTSDNFVNKEKYYTTIKPLVEKFFEQHSDIFKFTVDVDQSDVPIAIGTETISDENEVLEAIETLELLLLDPRIVDIDKKLSVLKNKKEKLVERWDKAKEKSRDVMNNIGFGAGMRRTKVSFSTSKEDEIRDKIKEVDAEIETLQSQQEIEEAIEILKMLV